MVNSRSKSPPPLGKVSKSLTRFLINYKCNEHVFMWVQNKFLPGFDCRMCVFAQSPLAFLLYRHGDIIFIVSLLYHGATAEEGQSRARGFRGWRSLQIGGGRRREGGHLNPDSAGRSLLAQYLQWYKFNHIR